MAGPNRRQAAGRLVLSASRTLDGGTIYWTGGGALRVEALAADLAPIVLHDGRMVRVDRIGVDGAVVGWRIVRVESDDDIDMLVERWRDRLEREIVARIDGRSL